MGVFAIRFCSIIDNILLKVFSSVIARYLEQQVRLRFFDNLMIIPSFQFFEILPNSHTSYNSGCSNASAVISDEILSWTDPCCFWALCIASLISMMDCELQINRMLRILVKGFWGKSIVGVFNTFLISASVQHSVWFDLLQSFGYYQFDITVGLALIYFY